MAVNLIEGRTARADDATPEGVVDVMLVEDSALIREALVDACAASGKVAFSAFAATAREAVDILRDRTFPLIIIDLELMEGTGFDVLTFLAQPEQEGRRPVRMVLTNHAFALYEKRARMLGVEYFFDKSLHFDEAVSTLEKEAARLAALGRTTH
ncbi:response regulator [Amantichitinum ursilacus]|uniref:Chemotaxis response regulator protein-glutamate methylesterase n=1 Tax=Amantichitinum ursilacus TaxID=857265 RepID=A0A0N0GQJ7_9NEIS|nr:response regulator [Amantichitinum ursilacus]KPC54710.1 Chemotaxis response regulator protein-glutamate methylesterase [Amantichitinum ursilacus]